MLEAGERVLQRRGPVRLLPFLGPAFIAAVAYIDPGNCATHTEEERVRARLEARRTYP
jgi:manganese transport protein